MNAVIGLRKKQIKNRLRNKKQSLRALFFITQKIY